VALAGWFVTDAHLHCAEQKITFVQSLSKNRRKCVDIQKLLSLSGEKVKTYDSVYHRGEASEGLARYWSIRGPLVDRLTKDFPRRHLTVPFVSSLSPRQRKLLFDALIDADGSQNKNGIRFVHSIERGETVDALMALCQLMGKRVTVSKENDRTYRVFIQKEGCRYKPFAHVSQMKMKTVPYAGRIWCPHTSNETVIARRKGTSYITQQTWVYDDIYLNTGDPNLKVINATWRDNIFLTEEQKDQMRSRYTADALQVREEGKFVQRTGLVMSWFRRDPHILDANKMLEMIPKGCDVYCGIDFGYAKPCAVVYVAIDQDDNHYIIDGFYKRGLTTPRIAELMKRKEKALIDMGFTIRSRYGDSANPSDIIEISSAPHNLPVIPVRKATGESQEGWDEYRARLMDEHGRIRPMTGRGKIYVSSALIEVDEQKGTEYNWFVKEAENLRWDDVKRDGVRTQVPRWSDKSPFHSIDAYSYILVSYAAPPPDPIAEARRRSRLAAESQDDLADTGWAACVGGALDGFLLPRYA
jgi:hypothetical protein